MADVQQPHRSRIRLVLDGGGTGGGGAHYVRGADVAAELRAEVCRLATDTAPAWTRQVPTAPGTDTGTGPVVVETAAGPAQLRCVRASAVVPVPRARIATERLFARAAGADVGPVLEHAACRAVFDACSAVWAVRLRLPSGPQRLHVLHTVGDVAFSAATVCAWRSIDVSDSWCPGATVQQQPQQQQEPAAPCGVKRPRQSGASSLSTAATALPFSEEEEEEQDEEAAPWVEWSAKATQEGEEEEVKKEEKEGEGEGLGTEPGQEQAGDGTALEVRAAGIVVQDCSAGGCCRVTVCAALRCAAADAALVAGGAGCALVLEGVCRRAAGGVPRGGLAGAAARFEHELFSLVAAPFAGRGWTPIAALGTHAVAFRFDRVVGARVVFALRGVQRTALAPRALLHLFETVLPRTNPFLARRRTRAARPGAFVAASLLKPCFLGGRARARVRCLGIAKELPDGSVLAGIRSLRHTDAIDDCDDDDDSAADGSNVERATGEEEAECETVDFYPTGFFAQRDSGGGGSTGGCVCRYACMLCLDAARHGGSAAALHAARQAFLNACASTMMLVAGLGRTLSGRVIPLDLVPILAAVAAALARTLPCGPACALAPARVAELEHLAACAAAAPPLLAPDGLCGTPPSAVPPPPPPTDGDGSSSDRLTLVTDVVSASGALQFLFLQTGAVRACAPAEAPCWGAVLPARVLERIFCSLPLGTLVQCERVSARFARLLRHSAAWRVQYAARGLAAEVLAGNAGAGAAAGAAAGAGLDYRACCLESVAIWRRWLGAPASVQTSPLTHRGCVSSLALADRRDAALSGGTDRTVRLWSRRARSGWLCLNTFGGVKAGVTGVALRDTCLVAGYRNGELRAWGARDWAPLVAARPVAAARGYHFAAPDSSSGDNSSNLVLAWDAQVHAFDLEALAPVATFAGHARRVVQAAPLAPHTLLSCALDRTLRVWDCRARACVLAAHDPAPAATALAVGAGMAAAGTAVATAARDGTVAAWDVRALARGPLRTVRAHAGAVRALRHAHGILVSGGDDGAVRVWDPELRACLHAFDDVVPAVSCLDFSNRMLCVGSATGTLKALFFFDTC